jgi:hypothetical protein
MNVFRCELASICGNLMGPTTSGDKQRSGSEVRWDLSVNLFWSISIAFSDFLARDLALFFTSNPFTMFSIRRAIQLASLLAIPVTSGPSNHSSYVSSLPANAQSLFTESMNWMDGFYDPSAGYLFDESSATALRHETRSSAWYAIGLLARNTGDDVENALQIISNVIDKQYKDPKDQWFVFSVFHYVRIWTDVS